MAGIFTATGTYANLTRLELEELRKADFYTNFKALTIGDSAYGVEDVVGRGDLHAEPYIGRPYTFEGSPSVLPPVQPGTRLISDEVCQWHGPSAVICGPLGSTGSATSTTQFSSSVDLVVAGVQAGDLLLIAGEATGISGQPNENIVAVVQTVDSPSLVTCTPISVPGGGTTFTVDGDSYKFFVYRPGAIQLFAVPGSGPLGQEQSFLAVNAGSWLHGAAGPTPTQIDGERIKFLIPPQLSLDSSVDRADAVFPSPAPLQPLTQLGYRVILYPSNGTGTGPDLTKPLATLNPVVDPSIPLDDQRVTIDYAAGLIRFSCAPALGGDIKVAGGVHPTTGRLNLYAVLWAFSPEALRGEALGLRVSRSQPVTFRQPTSVEYHETGLYSVNHTQMWSVGFVDRTASIPNKNRFYVYAPSPQEDWKAPTLFGSFFDTRFAYLGVAQSGPNAGRWRMGDGPGEITTDTGIEAKSQIQVGSSGLLYTGDYNHHWPGSEAEYGLSEALAEAATGTFPRVKLGRGQYFCSGSYTTYHLPPGTHLEGDGDSTRILTSGNGRALMRIGANTPWNVYDPTFQGSSLNPTLLTMLSSTKVEGYDIVWNAGRDAWGVFIADLANKAIWFNEIRSDGSTLFAGLGVDIKDTATDLYSNLHSYSTGHTAGHYPRAAHAISSGTGGIYHVVWVEAHTDGGVVGPRVKYRNFSVYDSATYPGISFRIRTPGEATQSTPTLNLGSVKDVAYFSTVFSDHPSIAVNGSGGKVAIAYAEITSLAATGLAAPVDRIPAGSYCSRITGNVTWGSPTWSHSRTTSIPGSGGWEAFTGTEVISSTDVTSDGATGFLYAYSVRRHSMLIATGYRTTSGAMHPDDTTSFDSFVKLGSKLLWLGDATTLNPNVPLDQSYGGAYETWGDAATVLLITPTYVRFRWQKTGRAYSDDFPFPLDLTTLFSQVLVPGGAPGDPQITNSPDARLVHAGHDFTLDGVQVHDWISVSSSTNGYPFIEWRQITEIPSVDTLKVNPNWTVTGSAVRYNIHPGNCTFAIIPQSYVFSVRALTPTLESAPVLLAGNPHSTTAVEVTAAQFEPDFVRVCKGAETFLATWQCFETTGKLATVRTPDLQDDPTSSINDYVAINEYRAPYRVHQGTFAAPISMWGFSNSPNTKTLNTAFADFDESANRNTHLTAVSLGVRNPLTQRPNYLVPTSRLRPHFDWVVNLNAFSHRWDMRFPPSLIPDATWNGADYVVVSPSQSNRYSYTGVYEVDGSGQVTLKDFTVYFGDGSASSRDPRVPARETIPPGSTIFFPTAGVSTTISAYRSAHSVQLAALDAALLNIGDNTSTRRVEWVLVTSSTVHGLKNPGYRVSEQGEVVVSSNYNTFADEISELENSVGEYDTTLVASRGCAIDHFTDTTTSNAGALAPNTSFLSSREFMTDYRYRGDVGFQGVAVGSPKPGAYNQRAEVPMVAIAWGNNLFGFVDRYDVNGSNSVAVYRQSFGPYNVVLKDLTLAFPYVGAATIPRTLQRVHTRWGAPVGITGTLETNGYHNVFVFPTQLNVPTTAWNKRTVQAVFTNATGRWPVEINAWESPTPPALTTRFNAAFQREQLIAIPRTRAFVAAPVVAWDGTRFVTAWAQSSDQHSFYLNFTYIPEDSNRNLMDSADAMTWRPMASVSLTGPGPASSLSYLALDIATSGNTYAVAWVMGLAGELGGTDYGSAVYGVTVFDKSEMGEGSFLRTDKPFVSGLTLTSNGTLLSRDPALTTASMSLTSYGIAVGDIVWIGTDQSRGMYQVRAVNSSTLTLDRSVPVGSGAVNITVCKPSTPATGRTYILSNLAFSDTDRTFAGTPPHITWDGQQYQLAWVADPSARLEDHGSGDSIWTIAVPEYGYGSGIQQKALSADISAAPRHAVGMLNKEDPTSTQLYLVRDSYYVVLTVNMSGSTVTITDGTPDPAFRGILEGDLMSYPGAAAWSGPWLVTGVNEGGTTFTVEGTLPTVMSATIYMYRTYMPNIQVGDIFNTSTYRVGTGSLAASAAILTVTEVDVQRRRITTTYDLLPASAVTPDNKELFFNGIITNSNSPGNNGSSPQPRALAMPPRAEMDSTVWFRPDVIHGVVHNKALDEYAVLTQQMQSGDRYLNVATWKKSSYVINKYTTLDQALGGAIAFNGEHYCVVELLCTAGVSPVPTGAIKATILSKSLQVITTVDLTTGISDLVGNTEGKTPGPGYSYPGVGGTGSDFTPLPQRVQVKWNATLSRWVVGVTVAWLPPSPTSGFPAYANALTLSLAATSSSGGNILNFASDPSNYVAQYFLPGLKVTAYTTGPTYLQTLTIINRTGGTSNASITVGERLISPSTDYDIWDIHPREDMFCFTFGISNPVVQLVNADGVVFDNVRVEGPGPVEELWPHMGKPTWLSSGSMVGPATTYLPVSSTSSTDTGVVGFPQVHDQRLLKPKDDAVVYTNPRGCKKGGAK